MTKNEFLGYLHDGDFRQLFLECFWSNPSTNSPYRFQAGEETFEVQEVAHIIDCIKPHSLILFNETFQTTSYAEGSEGMDASRVVGCSSRLCAVCVYRCLAGDSR